MSSDLVTQSKQRGDNFYRNGHFRAASKEFAIAIDHSEYDLKNDKNRHVYYSNRCACYLQLGEISKALDDAKKCVDLNPVFVKGHLRLACCLHKLDNNEAAKDVYRQVLKLDPTNAEAFKFLNASANESEQNSNRANSSTSNTSILPSWLMDICQTVFEAAKYYFKNMIVKIMSFASNVYMSNEYCTLFIVASCLALYWFYNFFTADTYYDSTHTHSDHFTSNAYSTRSSRSNSWSNNYGYSSPGLSLPVLGLIMYSAYILPPKAPHWLLPEQYARPYFGMSWSTFLYLLQLVSGGNGIMGGRGFYTGGFQAPMGNFRRRRTFW